MRVNTKGKAGDPKNAFYWKFIELGTAQQAATPFIRPSFDGALDAIEAAVKSRLAEGIDRAIRGG
ncbi:hypothetical protein D3C76_1871820 [compost metagenome]